METRILLTHRSNPAQLLRMLRHTEEMERGKLFFEAGNNRAMLAHAMFNANDLHGARIQFRLAGVDLLLFQQELHAKSMKHSAVTDPLCKPLQRQALAYIRLSHYIDAKILACATSHDTD